MSDDLATALDALPTRKRRLLTSWAMRQAVRYADEGDPRFGAVWHALAIEADDAQRRQDAALETMRVDLEDVGDGAYVTDVRTVIAKLEAEGWEVDGE